ncbi:MAG TPA: AEC family transporter [Quisquiliibacterium sp.]|nr:AEC family transporter [Quisquiliibacterium sp.]
MNIPALLFPDLALIVIGWLLYRHARLSPEFWAGAEKLVYYVLFPALLFGAIVRNPLSAGESLPMLASALGALGVGVLLGYAARPVLRPVETLFASGVQCSFRFNSYITLALALRIGGSEGLSLCALIVGFVVPIANLAAVYALARHSGAGVLSELARNPLVLTTLAALATKATGLQMPEPVDATLQRLGQAALSLGLLCVGAGLRFERPAAGTPGADPARRRSARLLTGWFTATKLVAMPLAALLIAMALQLPALPATIAVMFASMPTAPASYVLATRMGGDGPFVASLITVSLVASLAAIPFWLSLV